ncbi:MAG: amino acid permease [Chitinophagales bacterium]
MRGKINFATALSVVIANMVGTGVFTSLGFQLPGIPDYAAILILWIVGGIIALLGSFSYSELGAALPRSGGEYHFLSEIFHPSIGFLSGWVSATIGFAAPIAAASWALGSYMNKIFPSLHPQTTGSIVIVLVTIIQSISYEVGGGFQTVATSLKVLLILLFAGFGIFAVSQPNLHFLPTISTWHAVASPAFAISLVYVSFAYSGWNASAYIAGEMEQPKRNIPLSILGGTALVSILYILLNFVFLKTAPAKEMENVPEVAFVSAKYIFGEEGGRIISLIISILLVSTISSMVIVGPRILQMIGEDYPLFKALAKPNSKGIPVTAIVTQSVIALLLLYSSSFDMIITYISFTLTLFSTLTVLGVIVLRFKDPHLERPYKTFGYPITPVLYILANCWFLYFVFRGKPTEALVGLGIVAAGALVWLLIKKPANGGEIKRV